MSVPPHIYREDDFGFSWVRNKRLRRKLTRIQKEILAFFSRIWPRRARRKEAQEGTGHKDFPDHLRAIRNIDEDAWRGNEFTDPGFLWPEGPYGNDGYGFPPRGFYGQQDRGGGFGPRHS
jgi:hypothetical protein